MSQDDKELGKMLFLLVVSSAFLGWCLAKMFGAL